MNDETTDADDAPEEAQTEPEPGPAAAWALDPEDARPPDFSIVADDLLIAYVWSGHSGTLQRTGTHDAQPSVVLSFGDVLVFDAARSTLLQELASKATELDRFRFSVELEGWSWLEGVVTPHARLRRF